MKAKTNRTKHVLIFLFAVFSLTGTYAANISSTAAGGNWNVGTTWSGGTIPGAGDNVTIKNGATVTIDTDVTITNLTIDAGGSLVIGNDATARNLTVTGTTTNNGSFTVGAFDISHTVTFQNTVTNNATLNFRNSSSQVANVIFDGTTAYTVGGTTSPQFNNITFTNGTITAGVAFDINGSVTIDNGATFADGNLTHTVAGNWTENGTGARTGNGTIDMDASLIQSVTANATFYNLTYSNGGTAVLAGPVTVTNDFLITANTEVKTSTYHTIQGNFTIADGSLFTASAGAITMNSANAQALNIGTTSSEPNATFVNLYFDNGGAANPKTVTGNIVSNGTVIIYDDAQLDEAVANTYNHKLHYFRVDGTCNFSGTISAMGGTFYDGDNNDFTVGTADIIIFHNLYTQDGDIMRVNGNITIGDDSETYGSHLIVTNNSQLIGTNSKTLLTKAGKSLYIRGTNNFPSGFGTVTFDVGSYARYDSDIIQTIQDKNNVTQIQYYYLYLAHNTKNANGDLDINGHLFLYYDVDFQMKAFNHTIALSIINSDDLHGNGSLTSTGTVTFDAEDHDQYIYDAGTGSYTFENIRFTQTAPTVVHYKGFRNDITVNGNFTVTNSGGDNTNRLYIDSYENTISGSGNTFSLGKNVIFRTNGQSNFENSMANFGTKTLDINSTVRFQRNVAGSQQWIPTGITYGNIDIYGNNVKTLRGNIDVNGNFSAVGYTPVLTDNSNTIYVQGDWNMHQNYTNLTGTNNVVFDGTDQDISNSNFSNVYFNNSGTKTISGTLDILKNLNIEAGVTVETTRYIYIEGNWVDDGTFHQTGGITTFDGTTSDQTIKSGANSYFYSFYIDKSNVATKKVTLTSNIDINGTFNFVEDNANFDMAGYEMHVAHDFYFREGCTFTPNGGKAYFDGSDVAQLIRNYDVNTIEFKDAEFSGTAVKRLYNNSFRFKGDVTIDNTTLDGQWWDHYVEGDWINTGIFRHFRTLHFDGAQNQSISQSDFHTVRFGGGNHTKTLTGNIKLTGHLYIDDATLDVSTNNYNISLDNNWYNDSTGSFIARQGTVNINGEYSYMFTGESNTQYGSGTFLTTQGGTKSFYNLTVNKNDVVYYFIVRGDLHVNNNFDFEEGDYRKSYDPNVYGINDLYVKGDFINKGRISYNNYGSFITLEPTAGTHTFNPGSSNQYEILNFSGAAGTTYDFASNLACYTNRAITINNGTLNLKSNSITTNGTSGDITMNAGTLNVDSAAFISMGDDATFLNAGGTLNLVGHVDDPASLIATAGHYTYTQTSGTISAKNFRVEGTKGNGLDIQGGSVDATNTFQYGSFSSGIGTAYITTSGINLGADRTIDNTTFNSGPTYNVQRTSGTGDMNFVNASGTLAGEDHDNDPGTFVNWTYPGAAYWDGNTDGDGDNIHWNDPLNWVADAVPTNASKVILDHGAVAGAYTVNISNADADAEKILINSGANAITLVLNGHNLTVVDDITIGTNSVLTQTTATDKITLGGSWSNEGTFNEGTATVEFNPTSGTHTITTQGAGDSFYNVIFNGTGGTNVISSAVVDINGNVLIQGGNLNASSKTITVAGDWSKTGGTFTYGTSTVNFDNAGNQNINGGEFYNFTTSNSGTKTATANIDINNDLLINTGTVFDGGTNIIYVGDDWTNRVGNTGFTQTGSGTVILNGEHSTQYIIRNASTHPTTFNNLIVAGTQSKLIERDITIKGNFTITKASVYIRDGITIDGDGGINNSLNMSSGRIYVEGANNFPINFETINLTGGTIDYYADMDQTVYPTSYYQLMVRSPGATVTRTKTLADDIDVKESLYINDAHTLLDVDEHTITLIGNLSLATGAPQIDWGTNGTLIHYGTYFTVDADITNFNNVIKKNRGYFYVTYTDLDFTGNFSILEDAYLNHGNVLINCTAANKTFTLAATAHVNEYVTETLGAVTGRKAFPTNFANYNIHKNSRVYFRGAENQLVYTTPTYGNIYISSGAEIDVMLDGNLDVDGSFYMHSDDPELKDEGHNINIAGANIDLRKYMPTIGTTFTLDGENQRLYDYGHGANTIDLANVVFAGSGQKDLTCSSDDYYKITENLTINAGVTVFSNRKIDFSGQNWTNNGIFNHTRDVVYFTRAGNQTIDPGAENDFYSVSFSGGSTKTFINSGIDVYNGEFTIENATTAHMGNGLTHNIASVRITNNGGTWTTDMANFVFDRNGTQYLPAMTAKNITFRRYDQWDRVRYLEGALNINDLNIEEGTQLRCSANDENSTPTYNVTMTGNFINNGTLYAYGNTFKFESDNTDGRTIKQGNGYFHNVTFNQNISTQKVRTYTLTEETRFYEDLTIGKNATLDMNGQILHLGNDDANDPVEPNAEEHLIQANGKLIVDEGASLQFSCRDVGNPKMTVEGTLEVVGVNGNNAVITADQWYTNAHRINIDITTGTIAAEYYLIQYLVDEGLEIQSGATIDATHNLSNGTWTNMNTAGGSSKYYISCDAPAPANDIDNVAFNFATTPTQGVHFNMKRAAGSTGVITFGGTSSGLLAGEFYEADDTGVNNTATSLIEWPPISEVYWTGNVSTNWFDPLNWSPNLLPSSTRSAVIPLMNNNPIIAGQTGVNAECLDLKITDGFLTMQSGWDLKVNQDVYVGTGSNVGILAIEDSGCEIEVVENWTRAVNAVFVHGNGTVKFTAGGGNVSITPRTSAFYNVNFDGGATFMISSANSYVDGNFTITNGTVSPSVDNYNLYIKGNYNKIAGEFSTIRYGIVHFDGSGNQTITNGTFWAVTVDGSGTKTTSNLCTIDGNLILDNATFKGGDLIDMNNNVTINAGGTFDDGGYTHTFGGNRWIGTGAYLGTGVVEFDRNGHQYIKASKFNSLLLKNNGPVILEGNVDVTGDVKIIAPNVYLNVQGYILKNTDGTGTFAMEDTRRIYVRGANNYPSGFDNYNLHENSYSMYDGTITQTIAPVPIVYGRVYLDNGDKVLGGHVDIDGLLYFHDDANLDVTTNNYRINIEGHWYNRDGATFEPREGEVIFDGSDAISYMFIYEDSRLTNPFYKLSINKLAGDVRTHYTDITVRNNLRVLNGVLYNSRTMYIGGDMSALSGTFHTSGTYYLNKPSGSSNLQVNGSILNNLTVDAPNTIYYLQDNLDMHGNFKIIAGTFDGNGKTVKMGNYGEVHEISGIYKTQPGGILQLPDYSTFKVNSGGEVYVVGDVSNVATVTNITGRYYFNIENGGTIFARNYLFEYMAANGIYVKDGATISPTYNFSYGAFSNIEAGGACLRIENNQDLTEANGHPIREASFPLNAGGGAHNVTKTIALTGTIDFKDYSGEFAGEDFDNDSRNLINWVSPPYIMWTGNVDNDWFKIGNWEVSSGPDRIPLITDNVIITQRVNQPIIDHSGAAVAKSIDLQDNSMLTLNSALAAGTTLEVAEDISFTGMLVMTTTNDILTVAGNWNNSGTFTCGLGTVIMNSQQGIKNINNRNDKFYNLTINSVSLVQLVENTTVDNDVTITSGTLDLTASNRTLTIKGNYYNNSQIDTHSGKIVLAGQTGTYDFKPGNGSDYYNIDLSAAPAVTYRIITDELSLKHNMNVNSGTFSLNGNTFKMGDGSGTDVLTVAGGTILVDGNSFLNMGNNASIEVNNNGALKIVGLNIDNPGSIRSETGEYSVNINSGGTIHAKYFDIQNTDINGIYVKVGATIDATNNFSFGAFRNGNSSGQYLWLQNNFADYTAEKVYFHGGASVNVRRRPAFGATGVITFEDALGSVAGETHEDDDLSATTGQVRWNNTHQKYVWVGSVSTDWNNNLNWNVAIPHTVPTADEIALIPDIDEATHFNPIISSTGDANCYDLIIENGGFVTMQDGNNLTAANSLVVENGGTLTVTPGSVSNITVADIYIMEGTYNHGNSSTVIFNAPSGKILAISSASSFYNLTINSAGVAEYTTGTSLHIDGTFNINHGVFTVSAPSDIIYIGKDWINTATFNHGDGKVVFDGATQNITNSGTGNFFNVNFEGTNTKTIQTDVIVENDIRIGSSATLNGSTHQITLSGDWTNRGSFVPSTGTVYFNGSNTQLVNNYNNENFYNFTLNNTATTYPQVILYSHLKLLANSTWTMTDGIFETSATEMLYLEDNVTLVGGNTENSYVSGPITKFGDDDFIFPLGDGTIFARLAMNLDNTGTSTFVAQYHDAPYSDVTNFAAPLNHVSGSEHWTFDRISGSENPILTFYWEDGSRSGIDKLSSLTTAEYVTDKWEDRGQASTTGTILQGTITSNAAITTFGAVTFGSLDTDNPLNSYNFWTGAVSIQWENPNNWTIGVPTTSLNSLIPAEPVLQPTIDSDAEVAQLIINENAMLTINPLRSLRNVKKLYINGGLLLKSDNTGNASLISEGAVSYGANSDVKQELYLKGGQYHHISSSMTSTKADRYKSDPYAPYYNPNFYYYDEHDLNPIWTDGWHEYNGTSNMGIMTGYTFYASADFTNTLSRSNSGDFNTGGKSLPLTYTGGSAAPVIHRGWNFVGNPYPAHIDWNSGSWTKTNIHNSIYFWNGTNYSYYVSSGTAQIDPDPAAVNNGSNIIPPMQGYFVKVLGNDAGNYTGTLGTPEDARTTATHAYYKNARPIVDAIRLTVEGNGHQDETLVRFVAASTPQFDSNYDAFKLFPSSYLGVPQIYSVLSEELIASINTLPEAYDDLVIPLGFRAEADNDYTITTGDIDFDEYTEAWFEDMQEGKIFNIQNLNYTFFSETGQFDNRFRIVFAIEEEPTEIENNLSDKKPEVSIYSIGDVIYLKSTTHDAIIGNVQITNIAGQTVTNINNTKGGMSSIPFGHAAGVYFVKVNSKYGTYTERVLISR